MNWQEIKISFWMAAGNTVALVKTLNRWFQYIRDLLHWPVQQYDLETAPLFIVDMIAEERDVQRYRGEPESLYRSRVINAYQNARDAGTVAGFKAIWARCGLGDCEIVERIPGEDWDIVQLWSDVQIIADNPELIRILIEKYGRTCRRYQIASRATIDAGTKAGALTAEGAIAVATAQTDFSDVLTTDTGPLTINGQIVRL